MLLRRLLWGTLLFAMSGCSMLWDGLLSANLPADSTVVPVRAALPDLGAAPELANDTWLNTSSPLRLADLRGRVTLINFWTFGCINCKHVLPHVRQWYDTYGDKGLTVIGIHYPEFSYEANLDNLKQAAQQLGVNWPVAQDNDGKTWNAYRQRYWPTIYLIDKRGAIRYVHIGEGAYDQTETAIRVLLNEPS